jgi:hypothetical protein
MNDASVETETVECADCKGAGEALCFIDGPWGGRAAMTPCLRCKGNGAMPPEMLDWIRIGSACRDLRIDRGELTRDVSTRTGLRDTEISAMEMGRTRPDPKALGLDEEEVMRRAGSARTAGIPQGTVAPAAGELPAAAPVFEGEECVRCRRRGYVIHTDDGQPSACWSCGQIQPAGAAGWGS